MKKIIFLLAAGIVSGQLGAQQNSFNCISHEVYARQMASDPEFKKNQEQLEIDTRNFVMSHAANKTTSATYIIPMVFHVIHTGGAGNISQAQIMDQVAILNKEFNRMQADTILTPAPFKSLAAPFSVEFRLATVDPSGNCTNGIDRVYNSLATCSNGWDDVKALSYWPSNKYLNIWIIESMHYPGSNVCNGGGYTTFPGGPAAKDGIVMRGDLISNIGTAVTNTGWGNFKGRYLVHELGHWFNLIHIWGDANCGNDYVADTPPAVTDNGGCPTFPHNPNNSCGSNANGEMFCNYMDYSTGSCLNMFSAGQVQRMTAAINSSASSKNNLWTNANLLATGTSDPYAYPVNCGANPDILPYGHIVVCQGDSVKFTDYSYGGQSTSRNWDFALQPASSLSDSIVKVKYASPGTYSVSLTKNYLSSSKMANYVNKVHVLGNTANPAYVMPFTDSLENAARFNNDWLVINSNNDARTWQRTNLTSFSGSACVSIANFNGTAPSTDDLISPAYNLSAYSTATLSFMLHFAATATVNTDKLSVYMSTDCGSLWYILYQKVGNLKTIPTLQGSSYVPAPGSAEWRQETIELPNDWATTPVRFKFSFTSGGGNNIYIDDINVKGDLSVGIKNQFLVNNIVLYPNPAEEQVNIKYNLVDKNDISVELFDITGRACLQQNERQPHEGENTMTLNTAALSNGIYLIKLKQNGAVIYTSKFLKQTSH